MHRLSPDLPRTSGRPLYSEGWGAPGLKGSLAAPLSLPQAAVALTEARMTAEAVLGGRAGCPGGRGIVTSPTVPRGCRPTRLGLSALPYRPSHSSLAHQAEALPEPSGLDT